MTDPTLIADLIRAGVDPDMVARVSSAILAAAVGAPRGPSKAAVRTQRWREKIASQNVTERHGDGIEKAPEPPVTERHQPSQNVTRDVETRSALSFLEDNKKEERKKEKKERAKRDCGHKLPPDWRPKDFHYREASDLFGQNRKWVDDCATELRIWGDTNSHRAVARKTNWDLTFSGWMRRESKKARAGPNGHAPRPGSREDRQERTSNALAKLSQFIENGANEQNRGGDARAPITGFLSFDEPSRS